MITCNATISACEKAFAWQMALDCHRLSWIQRLADVIAYTEFAFACPKVKCQQAVHLLQDLTWVCMTKKEVKGIIYGIMTIGFRLEIFASGI